MRYTEYLRDALYDKKNTDINDVRHVAALIEKIPHDLNVILPTIYAVDYTAKQYILLKSQIHTPLGYKVGDIISGGLQFIIDNYQQDDFATYNEHIFKETLAFLERTPQHEHSKLIFTYNYRLKNKFRGLTTILQKGSYITSPVSGLPVLGYGIISDITSFKRDTSMVQVIDKITENPAGYTTLENITTNYFYPYPEKCKLTRREREILFWVAEGLSIKELAQKLFLTESTVTNHRASIMRKTNTRNVAHLIRYALENNLL